MQTILFQESLTEEELRALQKEFPFYRFLPLEGHKLQEMAKADLAEVEIFFGHRLPKPFASQMHQLKWVHCTKPWIDELALDLLREKNVLITLTKEENVQQAVEYAFWAILESYKQGVAWHILSEKSDVEQEEIARSKMEGLAGKKFLQLGLGRTGSLIAKMAKELQMKVFGVQREKRFHAACLKTFAFEDLHALLPGADIICLAPSSEERVNWFFGKAEWSLMKPSTLFIGIHALHLVDHGALLKALEEDHLRGVVLDGQRSYLPASDSPLRRFKRAIFTPEVAFCPKWQSQQAMHVFRYNLRHYTHGNANEMKNQLAMVR